MIEKEANEYDGDHMVNFIKNDTYFKCDKMKITDIDSVELFQYTYVWRAVFFLCTCVDTSYVRIGKVKYSKHLLKYPVENTLEYRIHVPRCANKLRTRSLTHWLEYIHPPGTMIISRPAHKNGWIWFRFVLMAIFSFSSVSILLAAQQP